jgi:TatA/E family protein of Tat protein translocase
MLDIGFQELLILGVLALLVFGPHKLPELGRALGRAMREFRRASDEFRSTIETNLNLTEDTLTPSIQPESAGGTGSSGSTWDQASIPAPSEPTPFGAPSGAPTSDDGGSLALAPPMAPLEAFCAQRGGRLLHRSTCGWARRIQEAERVAYKTALEGFELGLDRCPVCVPADEPVPDST